jgi:hypothetical protein
MQTQTHLHHQALRPLPVPGQVGIPTGLARALACAARRVRDIAAGYNHAQRQLFKGPARLRRINWWVHAGVQLAVIAIRRLTRRMRTRWRTAFLVTGAVLMTVGFRAAQRHGLRPRHADPPLRCARQAGGQPLPGRSPAGQGVLARLTGRPGPCLPPATTIGVSWPSSACAACHTAAHQQPVRQEKSGLLLSTAGES